MTSSAPRRGKTTAASNAGSFAHKQHGEPGTGVDLAATDAATDQTADQTADQRGIPDPADVVSACPRCQSPMIGAIRRASGATPDTGPDWGPDSGPDEQPPAPAHLPGARCEFCDWTAPKLTWTGDGKTRELGTDGAITTTDEDGESTVATLYSSAWSSDNAWGLSATSVRRATEAVANPMVPVGDQLDTIGAYDLAPLYEVVADRRSVPNGVLAGRSALSLQEDYALVWGPTVDAVERDLRPTSSSVTGGHPPLTDEGRERVNAACEAAGLPAMRAVYETLNQRGALAEETARALTPEAVETAYLAHVGPAVDTVEARMISEATLAVSRRTGADISAAIEAMRSPSDRSGSSDRSGPGHAAVESFIEAHEAIAFRFLDSPRTAAAFSAYRKALGALVRDHDFGASGNRAERQSIAEARGSMIRAVNRAAAFEGRLAV